MLKNLLSAPIFPEDAEKTRSAKLLHQIITVIWVLPILLVTIGTIGGRAEVFPPAIFIFITLLILMTFNRMGWVSLASIFITAMVVLVGVYADFQNAGNIQPSTLIMAISIITSGLLLGRRAPLVTAILISISHGIIVYFQTQGAIKLSSAPAIGPENIIITSIMVLMTGFLFQFVISRLQLALDQARDNETDLQTSNLVLTNLTETLEQRVAERTKDVEKQQQDAEKRSRQFEAIIRISKTINTAKNLHETLPLITKLISEQFDFYHVGIFLNDTINQYAILSAANSEGGQRMLNRGHQLKIGEQGIVGYVTGSGNPRIALDVGVDTTYFNNPDLPLTHSEMALPLKSGNEVIGALDIQSVEQNAFAQEDVEVLEALAEQVSLAIQNTRLFDQTSRLLSESEAIQKQYQRDTWGRLARENRLSGYKYTITGATALEGNESSIQADNNTRRDIAVPISLRGEKIGTLIVQVPANERVNTDQMDLIRAVAERVALSAENARLFEETNRRAEREQVISDISAKISTSVRTENILKTTAQELNQILDGAEVLIKLGTDRNR